MAKVMLVEDDNNLREIYGARLEAEGYDIVSAQDGEEALALAVKEKPDLIISDVMMPRISGFDMLDILRNAPETKETKVIMMTALSQAEDKSRADKLGADRYLVKSQVTLEDVANVVREVLEGKPAEDSQAATTAATETQGTTAVSETAQAAPTAEQPATAASQPQPDSVPAPAPASEPAPNPEPVAPVPPPATNEATLPPAAVAPAPEPQIKPEIPEIVAAPAEPATPEPAPTVEAIANPEVEVQGDDKPGEVQAPPQVDESIANEQSTAPAPSLPTAAPAPAISSATSAASDDTDMPVPTPPVTEKQDPLPPIVEPGQQPIAPIKVELPTQTAETPAAPASEPAAAEPAAPSTESTESENTPAPIGPSLVEALENEEKEMAAATSIPVQVESTPAVDAVVNGAPMQTVVAPTASPEAEKPADETPAEPPQTSSGDVKGKLVIQPLNDPSSTPDLNELLAKEEQKAAISNPAASTIIAPSTSAATPTSPQPPEAAPPAQSGVQPQPPSNDINNIAL